MEKQSGVRFLINKRSKINVIEFTVSSDRIESVQIKLTSGYKMSITQVYAPTPMSSEEEQENFYNDLQTTMSHDKSQFNIIMGTLRPKLVKETEKHVWGIWILN